MSGTPTPEKIMQVGLGFWASKTLLSGVELELFTVLAEQPADGTSLRKRLGLHERAAQDFFDALVALGFLERHDGKYHNTPATDLFLDKNKPSYLGGILEMANQRLYGFWDNLTEALQTGAAQNESKEGGQPFFQVLYADPERLKQFLAAMTGLSQPANQRIAHSFPWSEYQTFADVGTAQGDLAVQVALANPHLRGVGFDLPAVAPVFEQYVAHHRLDDRLQFAPGDFLQDALPQVDVIMLGHILHDWNLEEKKMLLRKAFEAVPANGAVIVYEAMIDDDRSQNALGLLMSLNMLIETPGGFDYTGADCCRWLQEVGFRETRVEHLAGPDSMVIGIK